MIKSREPLNDIEKQQLCETTLECLRYGVGSLGELPGLIEKIIENKAWESRRVHTGAIVTCKNLRELITAPPMKGWGESEDKILAVLKDHPKALGKFREAMKKKTGPKDASSYRDNITETSPRQSGTSKAYTIARLERVAPELYEQVCNGDLSANAAAIAAGIRKVKNPDEKAVDAFRKAENKLVVLNAAFISMEPYELNAAKLMIESVLESNDE